MEKLYTVNEVCKILKVTRRTIERWRKGKMIDVLDINGSLRIKESELKRLMGETNEQ